MKYGIFTFPTEYSIRMDQLARAVEDRGFESLWLPEHTHIPVLRRSPYPGGGRLPEDYFHIAGHLQAIDHQLPLDPFAHRPPDNPAREQIEDHRQIQPAF